MGGFGALYNLAMHPQIYKAAFGAKSLFDLIGHSGQFGLASALGTYQENPIDYRNADILVNAARLRGIGAAIRFYSGPNDWFQDENRRLHRLLDSIGVVHTYFENDEGHYPVAPPTMLRMLRFFDSTFAGQRQSVRKPGSLLRENGGKRNNSDPGRTQRRFTLQGRASIARQERSGPGLYIR
jgi:hypothetical protein